MRLQFLPYNPSKSSYDLDETAEESPQQHAARVYHGKAKLRRNAARANQQSKANNTRRPAMHTQADLDQLEIETNSHGGGSSHSHSKSGNLLPSPMTVLGEGRVDPFDAYCTSGPRKIVHEMLDHAISYQWTLFAPDEKPASLLMVKTMVMDTAIRFPVCFHTLVYSGATHKAFHQSPAVNNTRSAVLRLRSKGEALKALRVASQAEETALNDVIIFSMALLAIMGYGEKVTSMTTHERRPMAAQQDGQFYASMEYEWTHWHVLIKVVKLKGGLHTIGFPGLAFAIASFDIHTSMMFQGKPSFPLWMPSSLVVGSWPTSQPGSPASQESPYLATGFAFLTDLGLSEALELLNVLHGMRNLIIAFDSFQRDHPDAPPIKMIIFARNLNQHELLTLPDLSEELFSESAATTRACGALALYELCRLCAFGFQMTVLLPNLHGNIDVTIPYAQRIKRCLQRATNDFCMYENPAYHDLFLWVTMMTAWLVRDTSLYTWFLDVLIEHVSAGRVDNQGNSGGLLWPNVRDILATFLWLDSECNVPCAAIWDEVEASQTPTERCVVI